MDSISSETSELVRIHVDGEEITATAEHPFYVPKKGWTAAVRLRAGDILVRLNGEYAVVEKVEHELLESPVTVYNFEVEGFHTYYVSHSGLLVHNACRNGAYNQAKRELGIPRREQPTSVEPNFGNRGELNPGRNYIFRNDPNLYIRDDVMGHVFYDGSILGPHFNTPNGKHFFYNK